MMMACSKFVFILMVISPLLPPIAAGDLYSPLSPFLSPVLDGICNVVECGKGKCQASSNHSFGFACECSAGWSQLHGGDHFRFLPCVIPNCSINYACSNDSVAPAPAPVPPPPNNLSLFDPCMLAFCGGGKCFTTSTFEHKCECKEGYSNLFNTSSFPCFKDCSLGANCADLGINLSNSSSASSPNLPDNSNSATDIPAPTNSMWLFALAASLAIVRSL